MNKHELAADVSKRMNVTRKIALEAVEAVFASLEGAMVNGDRVLITGFGTFEPTPREARSGFNPATGERITIPAATVPRFRPATGLKKVVNASKPAA